MSEYDFHLLCKVFFFPHSGFASDKAKKMHVCQTLMDSVFFLKDVVVKITQSTTKL